MALVLPSTRGYGWANYHERCAMSLMPAVIVSVDSPRRMASIAIEGRTNGATDYLEAEFCNPFGDKSEHTEIRARPGDRVWVMWQNDDPRYPVIIGYRPKNVENEIGFRRFEHANFQIQADDSFLIDAGNGVVIATRQLTIHAATAVTVITPKASFSGDVDVAGKLTFGTGLVGQGGAAIQGSLTNNGKDVGSAHVHKNVMRGKDLSDEPK